MGHVGNMLNSMQNGRGKEGKNVLQLDQNCLSCSGQPAQITSAFKVACLAYNPSTVNIEGQSYKREEILEVATRLLQAARQQYGLKQTPKDLIQLNTL